MAPVGVSFSLLIEDQGLIEVDFLPSWTHLILSHKCMFLGSLSRHNKDLERRTLKPLARHSSQVLDKLCYSS